MARRPDDEKKAMKRPDRGDRKHEQEQEQEQEQAQEQEPEHARLQNQLGNQGVAALFGAAGMRSGSSVEVEAARRKPEHEKEGQDFGGVDDPNDPDALGELDLTQSWNPGTTSPADRTGFVEPMPEDALGPEDEEFLKRIRTVQVGPLPPSTTLDSLLQPSGEVLSVSVQGWARGVARHVGPALHRRAWARLLTRSGPLLQDPSGRVLLLRSRVAALSSACLLSSPALGRDADVATCAFLDFQLELEARDWCVRAARLAVGDETRPTARGLLEKIVDDVVGRVRPRRFGGDAARSLDLTLRELFALDDARSLVPLLATATETEEDPEDPLGLDAIIAASTGGATDPNETMYRTTSQVAEKLAAALFLTRVRVAGTAISVAEVASLWSAGAPLETLREALSVLDSDTQAVLQQLREIARAAQRRSTPIPAIGAALARAANALEAARERARALLTMIIAGILPGDPRLQPVAPTEPDPLEAAWQDGYPADALPWLASLPPSLDRDAAIAFTRMVTSIEPGDVLEPLESVRRQALAAGDGMLAAAAAVCLGPVLLRAGQPQAALALAEEHRKPALQRRNGVWLADASLLAMEAHLAMGNAEEAERTRLEAGALLWRMGSEGGLTLLARWQPAPDEVA